MTAEVQSTPYDTLPNFVMRGLLVIPEMFVNRGGGGKKLTPWWRIDSSPEDFA